MIQYESSGRDLGGCMKCRLLNLDSSQLDTIVNNGYIVLEEFKDKYIYVDDIPDLKKLAKLLRCYIILGNDWDGNRDVVILNYYSIGLVTPTTNDIDWRF